MKKKISLLVSFVVLFAFAIPKSGLAQEEKAHFFIVTTWKTVMPDGGSEVERDSLLMEWVNGILKMNDKIISQKNYRHVYGNDMRDWVVISEYKSWGDIEEAWKMGNELMKKKWPNEKDKKMYFKKLMKYFPEHSDEIYMEMPKFGK